MTWLSFDKLNDISKNILENFDLFIRHFDLDIKETDRTYKGCCPIHANSDNENAFLMYKNSGVWMCNTHGCHNIFQQTPLGFIRGLISSRDGWPDCGECICSFGDAVSEAQNILNGSGVKTHKLKKRVKILKTQAFDYVEQRYCIETFKSQILCPSQYYLSRGFNKEVLKKFLVGDNKLKNTPLENRALVPILDNTGEFIVGCTARTLYNKCIVCSGYHGFGEVCPDPKFKPKAYQKWAHNKGFQRNRYLYNYWNVIKDYKKYNNEIILVEGPSEVWRLEELGITNALAIFGSNITKEQVSLIDQLNPSKIITIMDSDEGGLHAEESCKNALYKYKIQSIMPTQNDLGDMTREEIIDLFNKNINKIINI